MPTTDKAITIWERKIGDSWHHNHIEDGWHYGDSPRPRCPYQENCWTGVTWRKICAFLEDGVVTIDRRASSPRKRMHHER